MIKEIAWRNVKYTEISLFKGVCVRKRKTFRGFTASPTRMLLWTCWGAHSTINPSQIKCLIRNSNPEVFCKKAVPKSFAKLTEKNCASGTFLIKMLASRLYLYQKRLWHRYFPCEFCEVFKDVFFNRTPLLTTFAHFY